MFFFELLLIFLGINNFSFYLHEALHIHLHQLFSNVFLENMLVRLYFLFLIFDWVIFLFLCNYLK